MISTTTFAPIADRLGKLIPRLASEHEGEVIATVAAIGRTLTGAGCDWHDLAQRVAEPSITDFVADVFKAKQPTPPPTPEPSRAPPTPSKPKREPSPWPTWATLSRFQRLAWMDVIKAEADLMNAKETEAFSRFYQAHYTLQSGWSRQDINLFNRSVRSLWERGWRPDARAA